MLWREESRQRSLPTLQRGRRQTAREVIFNVDLKPCIVFHRYNCLSGCIYKDEEDPQGVRSQNYKMGPTLYFSQPSFCFARGDLPVECMDDFHWCYEGDCGPEFWETRFEVYLRGSESKISVPYKS